jgi:hypothetical protein
MRGLFLSGKAVGGYNSIGDIASCRFHSYPFVKLSGRGSSEIEGSLFLTPG